ncbi:MAG: hypothetical protein LC104_10465 [Bacteroidales bacterium]|nr:hypothetical protein [Bacteroidales bacterium]
MPQCLLLGGLVWVAGSGTPSASPEALVRAGNARFEVGQVEEAMALYQQASPRFPDPGLIAFNTAAALYQQGDYRGAELAYWQTLSDAAIPPTRQAEALFNRGVCLLKRGGEAQLYRVAIDCLEAAASHPAATAELEADARFNLELAKLLWNQARAQKSDPPQANAPAPDPPQPPPTSQDSPASEEPTPGTAGASQTLAATPKPARPDAKPRETAQTTPGIGTLPVLNDRSTVTPLSPTDTRALLDRIAQRLRNDRRSNARLVAGPERPHVRDW